MRNDVTQKIKSFHGIQPYALNTIIINIKLSLKLLYAVKQ